MRRGRGEGGLHWDEHRQRWIATVTVGYDSRGKRITRKASGKTKTEAKESSRSSSGTTTAWPHRQAAIPSPTR
jgi:hypothetical protein